MKSSNPNSGIYKADTTRTLDNNGGNPACNQGGMIVLERNGSRPSHKDDMYVVGTAYDGLQVSPTLTVNNANGAQRMPDKGNFNAVITYGLDRASFNQGQNAKYNFSVENDLAQTIVAKGPGGGTDRTVGALCARDYKGVGNQYVNDGKLIIQNIRESSGRQQNQDLRR